MFLSARLASLQLYSFCNVAGTCCVQYIVIVAEASCMVQLLLQQVSEISCNNDCTLYLLLYKFGCIQYSAVGICSCKRDLCYSRPFNLRAVT